MINNTLNEQISFSILMANYNNANYIEEAIRSVILQTYPLWELIIVDDCSSDNSIDIIKPFLKDKRIKLICNERNIGYGGSLRRAADNASNMIFGILDSDDKLHETALDVMAGAYKRNSQFGFIYSTCWGCDSELKNCVINKDIGTFRNIKSVFFREKISHFKTFKKEAYQKTSGFNVNQKKAVDKDIILKLEEVTNIKFINKPLYYHRYHENQISQGKYEFEAFVYYYRAKCKAYQRRLNTNFPNCTLKELYFQYFYIIFHKLILVLKKCLKFFRIPVFFIKIHKLTPKILIIRLEELKSLIKFL